MLKIYPIIISTAVLFISGCGDSVPEVQDPHNPKVDGVAMSKTDFLAKYCDGKVQETCQKVRNARSVDSTKSNPPRF